MIEPTIATVAPEITHQEMETSEIQEPVTVVAETAEITNDSNINPSPETDSEHISNEVVETEVVLEAAHKKRRRKPEIQEDNTIDDEFASRLDMSCAEATVAPMIVNAYVVEYVR